MMGSAETAGSNDASKSMGNADTAGSTAEMASLVLRAMGSIEKRRWVSLLSGDSINPATSGMHETAESITATPYTSTLLDKWLSDEKYTYVFAPIRMIVKPVI
jgi:hypothetical protein